MNGVAGLGGLLALIAFVVHAVVGGRELRLIRPASRGDKADEVWAQTLCGWHWVSLDLLAAGATLAAIGLGLRLDHDVEDAILLALGGYFGLCGLVWLGVVTAGARSVPRRFLKLPQWTICFAIAALAFLAR